MLQPWVLLCAVNLCAAGIAERAAAGFSSHGIPSVPVSGLQTAGRKVPVSYLSKDHETPFVFMPSLMHLHHSPKPFRASNDSLSSNAVTRGRKSQALFLALMKKNLNCSREVLSASVSGELVLWPPSYPALVEAGSREGTVRVASCSSCC